MNKSSFVQKQYYQQFNDQEPYEESHWERVKKVRALIPHLGNITKILDVGCADGQVLAPFTKNQQVIGLDISESFIQQAKKKNIKAQVFDLENGPLPFKDGIFDLVFAGEIIEHIIDTDHFLAEINRVLKKDGYLLLTSSNVRSLASLGMYFLDLPSQNSARYRSAHFRDFTLKTLRIALVNNGFRPLFAQGSSLYLPIVGHFGSFLASLLPSWSKHIILLAQKSGPIKNLKYSIDCSLYHQKG